MKYLFSFVIFFYSLNIYAIDIEEIISLEEMQGISKINKIQSELLPPLKTRGAGAKIFKNNAPLTTIIFTHSALHSAPILGSGILVSQEGHIITNYHVIANEDDTYFEPSIVIGFCTASKYDPEKSSPKYVADVISFSKKKDLALLKISDNLIKDKIPVTIASTYEDAEIAMPAHAIGNPDFEMCTYTDGKISQIRDYEWDYSLTYQGLNAEVIQTNTEIDGGNSGGPLFNDDGKLIGINTFGSDDTDINFAVSFNEIRNFLNNLPFIEKKNLDPNCSLRTIPKQEITGDWNRYLYDRNCDDYLEFIAWEDRTDSDEIIDYIHIDRNKNNILDVYVERQDGTLVYFYDDDEDGVDDKYCYANDENNIFDCKDKIDF